MSSVLKINGKNYPVTKLEIGIDPARGTDKSMLQVMNGLKMDFTINVKPFKEGLKQMLKLLYTKRDRKLRNKRGSFLIRENRRQK